jgi:hypothetical protein
LTVLAKAWAAGDWGLGMARTSSRKNATTDTGVNVHCVSTA